MPENAAVKYQAVTQLLTFLLLYFIFSHNVFTTNFHFSL